MPRSVEDRIGVIAPAKAGNGMHFSIGRMLPAAKAELPVLFDTDSVAESTQCTPTFSVSSRDCFSRCLAYPPGGDRDEIE